jgi:hypothetical protein
MSPRMQWHRTINKGTLHLASLYYRREFSSATHHSIKLVSSLPTWDLNTFRKLAFDPAFPAQLPSSHTTSPPACQKWFLLHENPDGDPQAQQQKSELNYPFWHQHQDITVPIELTQTSHDGTKAFHRSDGALKVFLDHSSPLKSALPGETAQPTMRQLPSLYIAQCPLVDLPRSLQEDLPVPELVLKAGRGDIYNSSLWMGRPPTFTPLHKDPNPNLFMQLAGCKIVRLFAPEVGSAIFDAVQSQVGGRGNAAFRGEEMMQGNERKAFEEAVWGNERCELSDWKTLGTEARLGMGDGLFIPKGWWHSVRGVGIGMNASVNWWFR